MLDWKSCLHGGSERIHGFYRVYRPRMTHDAPPMDQACAPTDSGCLLRKRKKWTSSRSALLTFRMGTALLSGYLTVDYVRSLEQSDFSKKQS